MGATLMIIIAVVLYFVPIDEIGLMWDFFEKCSS